MAPNTLPNNLFTISILRSISALVGDWALVIFCFACAIYFPHPAVYLIAAILIARSQLALAILMHESAHGILTKNRNINDFIGQVFTAAPLMLSMFSYRKGHLHHHVAPMTSSDPVAIVFGIANYPVLKRVLCWRLFKDLISISYFSSIYNFITGKYRDILPKTKSESGSTLFIVASIFVVNGILLGVLTALGHSWLYLSLWILPALTFLQVFARIRAITEHAGYPPGDDQTKNARTIIRPSWQTFFFGPHCIHYHIEHHQYVRAPFYHLPKIHKIMKSQGMLPADNLYKGYGKVLKDVTF